MCPFHRLERWPHPGLSFPHTINCNEESMVDLSNELHDLRVNL